LFATLVEDGVLASDERQVLNDIAKNLSIPRSSIEVIHGRYEFEESAPPKPPASKQKTAKQ